MSAVILLLITMTVAAFVGYPLFAAPQAEADLEAVIEQEVKKRRRRRRKPVSVEAQFCPQCGAAVQADDRFCRQCGTALTK